MRIELQHALQVLFGVTIASVDRQQMNRAAELPDRVVSCVGFFQFALCQRKIPIVEEIDKSQGAVGLVHRWIQCERALSILARERHVIAWRLVVDSQLQVDFRHRRIRKCKGGVEPYGFFKVMNGPMQIRGVIAKTCRSLAAQKILKCSGTRSERSLRPRGLSSVERKAHC